MEKKIGIKWYLVNDGKNAINVALISELLEGYDYVGIKTIGGGYTSAFGKDISTVIAEIATITGQI